MLHWANHLGSEPGFATWHIQVLLHQQLEIQSGKLSCSAHPELGSHEDGHPNSILVSRQTSPDLDSLRGSELALTWYVALLT